METSMDKSPVSLAQAALLLNTTVDAVRKRIKRGLLHAEKGDTGRWFVYIDTDRLEAASSVTHVECLQCKELKAERDILLSTIAARETHIGILQTERDAWHKHAKSITKRLNVKRHHTH